MNQTNNPMQELAAKIKAMAAMQVEIDAQRSEAVSTLREAIQDKVIELNNLIFDFNQMSIGGTFHDVSLVEGGTVRTRKPNADKYVTAPGRAPVVCPYCVMKGHDARSHKHQETKAAFTAEELIKLGLAPSVPGPVKVENAA